MTEGQQFLCLILDYFEGQTYEAFLFRFLAFVTELPRIDPNSQKPIVSLTLLSNQRFCVLI